MGRARRLWMGLLVASTMASIMAATAAAAEGSSTTTPAEDASTTTAAEDRGEEWVTGPPAPPSTAPLPPATAPRDGESGKAPPTEVLVVPPMPPEDKRVEVEVGDVDGPTFPELRWSSQRSRRELSGQGALDLDTGLWPGALPGMVFLPQQAGTATLWSRGRSDGVGVVVDGVPLVDGAGLVSPTESLGLLGAAQLRFRSGPQVFSPSLSHHSGVLEVDTGGNLTEMGESMRTDGLLAAGVGGADVEKGASTLVRTGWRQLRVIGHATLLHRDEQRTGRTILGVPPTTVSPSLLSGSGGAGGTAGARVDVVPFADSRLFVSWLAGRTVDAGTPAVCQTRDTQGRLSDCVRTLERGTDVAVVGLDMQRTVAGLRLTPTVRVHGQRALSFEERSGSDRSSVDTVQDEVIRGGASLGLTASPTEGILEMDPTLEVGVDVYGDRFVSSYQQRSLRRRDGDPPDGQARPDLSRFVDGTSAQNGALRARLALERGPVTVAGTTRLVIRQLSAPSIDDIDGAAVMNATNAFSIAPSLEVTTRLALASSVHTFVTVGRLGLAPSAASLVGGPGLLGAPRGASSSTASTSAAQLAGNRDFAELGVDGSWAPVDVALVVYGSLDRLDQTFDDDVDGSGSIGAAGLGSTGSLGLEGRIRLKPDLEGLTVEGVLAGVAVDTDPFSEDAAPHAGILAPTGSLSLNYQPRQGPVGGYLRVWGALPQGRLAPSETEVPAFCPERPTDPATPQERACSGVPGFGVLDVGAYLQLGQLRFDVSGENVFDTQGRATGAIMGTGGAAVRTRLAFVF